MIASYANTSSPRSRSTPSECSPESAIRADECVESATIASDRSTTCGSRDPVARTRRSASLGQLDEVSAIAKWSDATRFDSLPLVRSLRCALLVPSRLALVIDDSFRDPGSFQVCRQQWRLMPDRHGLDLQPGKRVMVANGHLLGQTAVVLSEVETSRYLVELDQLSSGERLAVISGRELAFLEAP